MRRPSVHRVDDVIKVLDYDGVSRVLGVVVGFRTRCGITGGAELLKLAGINNGTSRWCGGCYPHAPVDPRSTSRWANRTLA